MNNKKEYFLLVAFNNGCVLKCKMCYWWKYNEIDNNTFSICEWKKIIESLKENNNLIFKDITFVGGEPLLKEGILDMVHCAHKAGYSTTITTNAYLIDEKMAKEILDSGLRRLNISLDSFDEQKHDFMRGVKGSYRKVMDTIDALGGKIDIGIYTIIMKPNLDDLVELVDRVQSDNRISGINFQAIIKPLITSFDDNWYQRESYSFLWPDDIQKLIQVLTHLKERKKRGCKIQNTISQFDIFVEYFKNPQIFKYKTICNIHEKVIVINDKGDVSFCQSIEPIGNIKNEKLQDILNNNQRITQANIKIKQCRELCNYLFNCYYEE